MSVEFDALYFVKDPSMLKAFDFALGIFDSTIGDVETFDQLKEKPLKEIKKAVASALTSGIAYLANRGADEYLQEVGTVTWQAIKSGFAVENPRLVDATVSFCNSVNVVAVYCRPAA